MVTPGAGIALQKSEELGSKHHKLPKGLTHHSFQITLIPGTFLGLVLTRSIIDIPLHLCY